MASGVREPIPGGFHGIQPRSVPTTWARAGLSLLGRFGRLFSVSVTG